MKHRSLGRELALKYLFSVDATGDLSMAGFDEFARDQEKDRLAREFAESLTNGVLTARVRLIETLAGAAHAWNWSRMALIDRNLLLIGTYEILDCPDIPPQVTINEIVELAKSYGSVGTAAFVNGVLDTIHRGRPADAESATPDRPVVREEP